MTFIDIGFLMIILMFLLELEIFRLAVQRIHQKRKKMTAFTVSVKNFLVKITLRFFSSLSVVTIMVQTLLRQLRISLQIEKIMANAPLASYSLLYSQSISSINGKKGWLHLAGTPPTYQKKPCRNCTEKGVITGP